MPARRGVGRDGDRQFALVLARTVTLMPSVGPGCTGQCSNVPPATTSTVVPCWPPAGKRYVTLGGAADAERTTEAQSTQRKKHRVDEAHFWWFVHISSRIGVGSLTRWTGRPLGVYSILAGSMPSLV